MENNTSSNAFYRHAFNTLFNVKNIVTVHYQSLIEGYVAKREAHDFWELIYVDKSEIVVVVDDERKLVKKGQVIFIRPNAAHHVETLDKEPNIFILSFTCRSKSMQYFADKTLTVPEERKYILENIMSEADETFKIPDFNPELRKLEMRETETPGGEQVIKNLMEIFLIYLLRNDVSAVNTFFVSKSDSPEGIEDEIACILQDSVYADFSLDYLCEKLNYGKTYLCTVFRQKTGTSIYTAFLKMRIKEAKRLIRKGIPLGEISERLRYNSLSHFNRAFKKMTGMTPGEYRDSIR